MAATTQPRRYIARPRLGAVERWFIPALVLTAAVHAAGYYLLHVTPFAGFSPPRDLRPTARVFNIHQAVVDPKALEDKPKEEARQKPATKPNPDVTDIQIPGEAKPSYEQLMATAETVIAAPDAEKTMIAEKPKVEPTKSLNRMLAEDNAQQLPTDIKALTDQLLNSKPNVTGSHPSFDVLGSKTGSRPNAGPNQGPANFSNLDSLLSAKGPLSPKTAPILLPTDLLFDYDSADLRPQAVGSLQKLADLMMRNPNATFIIEGHTDSFGAPDYNLRLSLGRAESVKGWLANAAGIDPGRIQTRGYGMSRLLVRGGSVEEQQLNRRVEIVIRNNRATSGQ